MIVHPPLYFNNDIAKLTHTLKYLGLQLDNKISFSEHTGNKISKATKAVGLLRKLQSILHVETFWSFINHSWNPILTNGDVIYDQPPDTSFSNKTESVQYNAALATGGAIKGFSRDKLYQELELEYLQQRRWMMQLCLLYKFLSTVTHS